MEVDFPHPDSKSDQIHNWIFNNKSGKSGFILNKEISINKEFYALLKDSYLKDAFNSI